MMHKYAFICMSIGHSVVFPCQLTCAGTGWCEDRQFLVSVMTH